MALTASTQFSKHCALSYTARSTHKGSSVNMCLTNSEMCVFLFLSCKAVVMNRTQPASDISLLLPQKLAITTTLYIGSCRSPFIGGFTLCHVFSVYRTCRLLHMSVSTMHHDICLVNWTEIDVH